MIGSARLRLWDEGDAKQPWSDGVNTAVFNGELFNLPELQKTLGMLGASEIEVLVVGLTRLGPSFLNMVDGQFAGAMISNNDQSWVLFRDRWGQVPLYYFADEVELIVGSTPNVLRAYVGERAWTPDVAGLMETVCWWGPSAPRTAWQGVAQVPAGHVVEIARGVSPRSLKWATSVGGPDDSDSAQDNLVPDLARHLERSVATRSRTSGDGIAGSLSGGIDSFLVCAYATGHGLRHTFGLVSRFGNEDHVAQTAIARGLGVTHSVVELTPSRIASAFESEVRSIGVPLVRLGPVAMGMLAREVSTQGFRVCLTGEGADELFGGYDSFRLLASFMGMFPGVPWEAFGSAEFDAGRSAGAAYWKFASENAAGPLAARASLARLTTRYTTFPSASIVSEQESRALALLGDGADTLENLRQAEIDRLLACYLLPVQSDHAWANHAVEARFPWLSSEVANLALRTPVRRLIEPARGKIPIRQLGGQLVEQLGLPSVDFSKRAFRTELSSLMADPAAAQVITDLCRRCPASMIDVPAVLQLMEACAQRRRWSESQSMLVILTASLGVLCG